jgi:hypothetical protein
MIIYLYIKTHTITGLKYLGKTSKNPYTYDGSGVDWKMHLKKYGCEHSTEIIRECYSNKELSEWGRYYSRLLNVVNAQDDFGNKIWANRIPETGGGHCGLVAAKKISLKLKGIKKPPRSKEHKLNASLAQQGIPKPRSKEHQEAWVASSIINWANNVDRKQKVSQLGKSNKGRKHTPEALEKTINAKVLAT